MSSVQLPSVMRANVVTSYGEDFDATYKYVEDFPAPLKNINELGANEVYVKVHACGVNPVDYKTATGKMAPILSVKLPGALGRDISGEVIAIGSKVTRAKVGDHILSISEKLGGHAEYIRLPEAAIAIKPANISFVEAASLPVIISTVLQTYAAVPGGVKPEYKVLVHGGSGGTGSWAVLVAKHYFKCSKVFATCSTKNVNYVKSLGADRVIDYTCEKFDEVCQAENIDVVFDSVGEIETMDKSLEMLGKNKSGKKAYVTIAVPSYCEEGGIWNTTCLTSRISWKKFLSFFGPSFNIVFAVANGKQLQEFTEWIAQNNLIKSVPIHTYDLKDVAKAHKQSKTKRTVGKLVIEVIPAAPSALENAQ